MPRDIQWITGREEPAPNTYTCNEFLAGHRKILLLDQPEVAGPMTIEVSVGLSKCTVISQTPSSLEWNKGENAKKWYVRASHINIWTCTSIITNPLRLMIYLEWIVDLEHIILPYRYVSSLKCISPLCHVRITQNKQQSEIKNTKEMRTLVKQHCEIQVRQHPCNIKMIQFPYLNWCHTKCGDIVI